MAKPTNQPTLPERLKREVFPIFGLLLDDTFWAAPRRRRRDYVQQAIRKVLLDEFGVLRPLGMTMDQLFTFVETKLREVGIKRLSMSSLRRVLDGVTPLPRQPVPSERK